MNETTSYLHYYEFILEYSLGKQSQDANDIGRRRDQQGNKGFLQLRLSHVCNIPYSFIPAYLNKLKIYVRYLKKIRFLKHSLYKMFSTAYGESLRFVFIKNFKNLNLFEKFQIFNIQKQ